MKSEWPKLGVGVGLRTVHYEHVLNHIPEMDWFEIVSENFMDSGGRPRYILDKIREHYPIVMHGVSLSIGSADGLDQEYLERLKALIDEVDPQLVSDHLCFSNAGGDQLHDLLPLPHTDEAIRLVVKQVKQVQDFIERPIMLENVSSYFSFKHSEMPEWEFITTIAEEAGCGILLDINNIYVNAFNHKFDPLTFINAIPPHLVGQFHLAGHSDHDTYLFDTHVGPIIEDVWKLYQVALKRFGCVSTLIEWDSHIPPFQELQDEANRAKKLMNITLDNPYDQRRLDAHPS